MTGRQPRTQLWRLAMVLLLGAPMMARAGTPAPVSESALRACAVIAADADRLACYDRLAGRGSEARSSSASAAPSAPSATSATSIASAPPAAAVSAKPPAAPAAAGTSTFGSYQAEHPAPPAVAPSMQAKIMALGEAADGKMTVQLEGGALWKLVDDADPLLAVDDTVTITRGAFGSYLLHTPTQRIHRVRRMN